MFFYYLIMGSVDPLYIFRNQLYTLSIVDRTIKK